MGLNRTLFISFVSFFLIAGVPAHADEISDRIGALEQELKGLRNELRQRDEKAAEEAAGQMRLTPGKLEVKSADGNFSASVGGNLQLDAYTVNAGKYSSDGMAFRRARLILSGTLYRNWSYAVQVDFAGQKASIPSAYIAYAFAPQTVLYAGYPAEPFGMRNSMSNTSTLFMEAPLPGLFWPGNSMGLALRHSDGKSFGVHAGAFSVDPDSPTRTGLNGASGWAITGRGWLAPINTDDAAVHIGLSGSLRHGGGVFDADSGRRFYSFRTSPEISGQPPMLGTGKLRDVNRISLLGPELAAVYGPFEFEAEYLWGEIEGKRGRHSIVNGGFAQIGGFLNGGRRPYDVANGILGKVTQSGAIELVARASFLDLSDRAFTDSISGRATSYAAGVNYYFNPNVRLMVDYGITEADHVSGDHVTADILQSRLQLTF